MHSYFGLIRTETLLFIGAAHIKINNKTNIIMAHITIFDTPSLKHGFQNSKRLAL